MFCSKCGTEVKNGALFCQNCGANQNINLKNSSSPSEISPSTKPSFSANGFVSKPSAKTAFFPKKRVFKPHRHAYIHPPKDKIPLAETPHNGSVGLAEAIKFLQQFSAQEVEQHEKELLDYATAELQKIEGVRIYGTTSDKSPIISFNVEGCDHYDIGMILDKMGVAVRTGHHCAEPLMRRLGVEGTCRASFGLYNTCEEVDTLVAGIKRIQGMF